MIEENVKKILSEKSTYVQAEMLGDITDEFREGRDSYDLLDLINSDNKEIIWIGIYIIGEVIINNQNILSLIIKRFQELTTHEDSKIRYYILLNLGLLLEDINSKSAQKLYIRMSKDNDEAIKSKAKEFLSKDINQSS